MLGAIVHKLYTSSKTLPPRTPFRLVAISFILVCIEAVIQWYFNFSTKGVDLKLSLVIFTFYFMLFILSLDMKYQNNSFFDKHKNVWIHLRKLSILMFLLQRIPLSVFPAQMNSFVYTAVIFITTLILSEIVILLSKKFKFFKLIY